MLDAKLTDDLPLGKRRPKANAEPRCWACTAPVRSSGAVAFASVRQALVVADARLRRDGRLRPPTGPLLVLWLCERCIDVCARRTWSHIVLLATLYAEADLEQVRDRLRQLPWWSAEVAAALAQGHRIARRGPADRLLPNEQPLQYDKDSGLVA